MRAVAAAAALAATGCGALLNSNEGVPKPLRHVNTAYQLEGEVRDETTLAPMPGAVVTIETSLPGYVVTRRADAGGRYAIGYSVMYRPTNWVDTALFAVETDALVVSRISVRAEARGRCSPTHTFDVGHAPPTGFLLLVGDCGTYRPRPRRPGRRGPSVVRRRT